MEITGTLAAGFTKNKNELLALTVPSLTVTVIKEEPVCPCTGVSVV